jgi:putative ABC transport system substrate-binding protein
MPNARTPFWPFRSRRLSSYGATLAELLRLAADHVDRILKGTDPVELPVLQPTRFGFVINLRTARQLGTEVPCPSSTGPTR